MGMRPPRRWNFFGSLRKAMISSQSSLASSMPATSAKVTLFCDSFRSRARDLPKLIALPPDAWSWRMKKKKMTTRKIIGSQLTSTLAQMPFWSSALYSTFTSCCASSSSMRSLERPTVTRCSGPRSPLGSSQ